MHNRQTTLLLVSSILHFLFLPTFISAQLSCQSPTSLLADTLQAGTPLTLKFINKPTSLGSALLSDVSANLICSSTGDSVLTLATKLGSGKTTSVTLSPAQVSSALKACPANSFNVQYEEDTFLSKNTENCQGSFSIESPATTNQPQLEANKDALIGLPSLSVPLLIPDAPTTTTPTTTGSPSTTPTVVEPQPKTTTTVSPILPTTTTTTIVTTTGVPPVVVPPNHSSTTTPAPGTTTAPPKHPHPPAPTTTSRPPKSGGGKGDGGNDNNNNNNTPSPSPPTPSPSNDLASSDLQQSTGSGPSTVTIAGISVGILAGVFVILGAMLVWRKRAQRRADFDLFYGDTLAAASGFQPSGSSSSPSSSAAAEQPIYGRSAPEDEKYEMNGGVVGGAALNRKVSSNAPRRSRSHTSNHTNKSPHMQSSAPQPPLLMPMHPLPTAAGAGQDTSYYHQQHQQDSYYANQQYQQQQDYYASQHQHHQQQQQQQQPPKRKPSYRLPRHHPGFDYEYEQSVGQR